MRIDTALKYYKVEQVAVKQDFQTWKVLYITEEGKTFTNPMTALYRAVYDKAKADGHTEDQANDIAEDFCKRTKADEVKRIKKPSFN